MGDYVSRIKITADWLLLDFWGKKENIEIFECLTPLIPINVYTICPIFRIYI